MSSEDFLDKKKLKKLDQKMQVLLDRIGLDRKTQDEVFDKSTLHVLERLISNKVLDILDFPISTGKEGNVFRGVTPENKLVAVKIYRISTATFKHILKYIIGDPRFQSIHHSKRDIVFAWTKKEFVNLERLNNIGIKSPKPIKMIKNVLVMEYIGDYEKAAPLMKDVNLKNPEKTFNILLDYISKMYNEANLVHGDISSYNVLIYKDEPYLIDLGQAVLLEHPNSQELLKRDIHNLIDSFKKYKIKVDENKIYNEIINNKK